VIAALSRALPKGCRPSTSDLKVRIDGSDLTTYPDVSVLCGEPVPSSIDANAIRNPVILVEVTTRSTEDYDRGDKLSHYKQLPSLRAVLFISHRSRRITSVERTIEGWTERDVRGGETVSLETPRVALAVDEIYEGITLDPA